jgi:hypothetical protein
VTALRLHRRGFYGAARGFYPPKCRSPLFNKVDTLRATGPARLKGNMEHKIEISDDHIYTVDGIVRPSVTQIISNLGTRRLGSDGLLHWSPIGFDDRFCDDSGNSSTFGDAFHFVAARIIQDIEVKYDAAMEPWIIGMKKFLSHHDHIIRCIEAQSVEIPFYSKIYGFTGTPDWHFRTQEKTYGDFIIDWKTGALQEYSRIQTAGYEQLMKESIGIRNMHRWTVQILPNDYKIDKRTARNKEDWNNFLSLLNVWKMGA